jgi:hypothetical protein
LNYILDLQSKITKFVISEAYNLILFHYVSLFAYYKLCLKLFTYGLQKFGSFRENIFFDAQQLKCHKMSHNLDYFGPTYDIIGSDISIKSLKRKT